MVQVRQETAEAVGLKLFAQELGEHAAEWYTLYNVKLLTPNSPAATVFDRKTAMLDTEFQRYILAAIGGELRHYKERDDTYCPDCQTDAYDCDCEPEECDYCSYYDECDRPSYSPTEPLASILSSIRGAGRNYGWKEWVEYHDRLDSQGRMALLDAAIDTYNNDEWADGFGGPTWGRAAWVLRCRMFGHPGVRGPLKPQTFVDMVWDLQHNGGSLLNKAYRVDRLRTVLDLKHEWNLGDEVPEIWKRQTPDYALDALQRSLATRHRRTLVLLDSPGIRFKSER